MATGISITTSYTGEYKNQIISAALLSGVTLSAGAVTIKPNIKYKEVMKKLEVGALMADATCNFTAASSVTLTERILAPKEFQVNLELCKKDYHSDFEAISMGYSAFDVMPKNFSDYLVGLMTTKIAQENEINLWRGAVGAGAYDGFVTLATADATVLDVAAPAASITATNVITELGKVADRIPSALWGKEDLSIYVSQNIARAYIQALGGFGAVKNVAGTENVGSVGAAGLNNQGTQWYQNGGLSFGGTKIFVTNGLADNYMMAGQKENLFFGTGLMSDLNEVAVIDMSPIDGSQNVRFICRFTAGAQYGIGSEVVLYTHA